MPATTPNNLPYPLGTDRVMDGDDAIKALALALRYCTVSATVNLSTTPTAGVAVTFPAGLFSAAPVVLSILSGTGSTTWVGGVNGVTATGCNLFGRNITGSAGSGTAPIVGFAVQMAP